MSLASISSVESISHVYNATFSINPIVDRHRKPCVSIEYQPLEHLVPNHRFQKTVAETTHSKDCRMTQLARNAFMVRIWCDRLIGLICLALLVHPGNCARGRPPLHSRIIASVHSFTNQSERVSLSSNPDNDFSELFLRPSTSSR